MNSKLLKFLGVAIVIVCTVMAFHTVSAQAPAAPAAAPAVAAPAETPAATPVAAPAAAPAEAPAAAPAEAPAAAPAVAAPDIKPAVTSQLELRKSGIVSATKDASGKVTGLKLIVNSYDIPLDEGSKPLETMDGQKVRVTGTFSNEGGKRMFYVKSVELAPAEGAATTPAKPVEVTPAK